MLGISRQTLQGRCAILCGKQYPKHFSSGFWIALHWIKTAKPLRETKVYVNADLSYLLFTALEVVPVLYEIFIYYFPWATLKAGTVEWRNGGMAENGPKS